MSADPAITTTISPSPVEWLSPAPIAQTAPSSGFRLRIAIAPQTANAAMSGCAYSIDWTIASTPTAQIVTVHSAVRRPKSGSSSTPRPTAVASDAASERTSPAISIGRRVTVCSAAISIG